MKVLFINTIFGRGSTGRIVNDIGAKLESEGHSYVVAYGRGGRSDDPHAYYIGSSVDSLAHAALTRITDKCGFYSKAATRKLVGFIRTYQPDVIHLHNLHGYYVNIDILFDYLKHEFIGKVVWTLHDCWSFTGHCVHFSYVKCEKWKNGCAQCPEKGRYPRSVFWDRSKQNYIEKRAALTGLKNMTIVTPSQWLAEQVRLSFLRDYPCVVIHNGIDQEQFCPQDVQRDEKLLLNVADGMDDRKGYPDLVRLMELLPKDYKLVVVGVQKRDLRKISSAITPVLRTSSVKELAKYYSRAAWFVNPTYEDNFPTVNIEALSCGTPVITYRSGGSPEIIDKSCGIAVEPGDVEAVAEYIVSNTTIPATVCTKRAKRFNKHEQYRHYIELYSD